jgi:hypothetical protein
MADEIMVNILIFAAFGLVVRVGALTIIITNK